MYKPKSVLESESHKILWDFDIQTNNLIPARKADLEIVNKKKKKKKKKRKEENLPTSGFCRPGGPQNENQRKRKERQTLRPCQRTEKAMENKDNGDTNSNWCVSNNLQKLSKEGWKSWKSGDDPRPSKLQHY